MYYEDVLRQLQIVPLNTHFDRAWWSHIQIKALLYDVDSQLQASIGLHASEELGTEICRLKVR